MEHLKKSGVDTKTIWTEIKNLSRTILSSILPLMRLEFNC